MSDFILMNESSVLEALSTAVSACAGWRAGSLPSRLNEGEIDCFRTLFTAATSPEHSSLIVSLLHSHQLVEKLASAVKDVTLSWLQQAQQDPEQQHRCMLISTADRWQLRRLGSAVPIN
jgi:hypothetical protein